MPARRPAPSAWPGRSVGWPTTPSASGSSLPWWTRTTPRRCAGRSSSPRCRAGRTSGRTSAVRCPRVTAPTASRARNGSARWPTPASSSSPPASTGRRPARVVLGSFVVPRELDGAPNGFALRRLKDKLGTRGLASGEIDFDGALAWPVGPVEHGFRTAVGIVLNTSRWMTAVGDAGMMRRAYLEAAAYAVHRQAFGQPIGAFPAVRRTLADMASAVRRRPAPGAGADGTRGPHRRRHRRRRGRPPAPVPGEPGQVPRLRPGHRGGARGRRGARGERRHRGLQRPPPPLPRRHGLRVVGGQPQRPGRAGAHRPPPTADPRRGRALARAEWWGRWPTRGWPRSSARSWRSRSVPPGRA